MMKTKRMVCMLCAAVMLAGCDSSHLKVEESETFNIMSESAPSAIKSVTLYYDTANNMSEIVKQTSFKDVAMTANSVCNEIALGYNNNADMSDVERDRDEDEGSTASVSNTIKSSGSTGNADISSSDFTSYISGDGVYTFDKVNVFTDNIKAADPDGLTVIITDLASQIEDDFVNVGNEIATNILQKDLALAFICIYDYVDNPDNKPYFITAIGNNDVVSDFVARFKEDRAIQNLTVSGAGNIFEEDRTDTVNYEIFANKYGINGINYERIDFIENGIVYDFGAAALEDITDGAIRLAEPAIEYSTEVDPSGSFSNVNTDFDYTNYLDRENGIEGTVNFDPTISEASDDTSVLVRYKNVKTADGERCDTEDIRYLAAVPLTSDSDEYDLAGKLKMKIPFDIIEGVKLSLLECDITTDIYYVDADSKGSGTFVSYTGTTDLQTSIAEGVKNIHGKWRVDDTDNSLVFNISAPHLSELFDSISPDTPFLKVNVMFNHYKSKNMVPRWALDLSGSGISDNARVPNLERLFDNIYNYQIDGNKAVNGFTIYFKNPDSSWYNRDSRDED
ncbi:MAG: hypothetical protein LUC97_03075 [Clostridiales bacterium]|nr:hypothetical protein [Clostridiales bacterium]